MNTSAVVFLTISSFSLFLFLLLHLFLLSFSPPTVGHGQSEGERMTIKDFQFYVRDSLQHIDLMKSRYPQLPVFILGHSMVRQASPGSICYFVPPICGRSNNLSVLAQSVFLLEAVNRLGFLEICGGF